MRTAAWLNATYNLSWWSSGSQFVLDAFALSGGRTCFSGQAVEPGFDLILVRLLTNDRNPAGPAAAAFWWAIP